MSANVKPASMRARPSSGAPPRPWRRRSRLPVPPRDPQDPIPLAAAEAARRAIAAERLCWVDPLAHVLRAAIAAHPGGGGGALAVAGFDAHLTGDAPRMHAAARITELGAANPTRLAACLVRL